VVGKGSYDRVTYPFHTSIDLFAWLLSCPQDQEETTFGAAKGKLIYPKSKVAMLLSSILHCICVA
jgi:hypothetical protein